MRIVIINTMNTTHNYSYLPYKRQYNAATLPESYSESFAFHSSREAAILHVPTALNSHRCPRWYRWGPGLRWRGGWWKRWIDWERTWLYVVMSKCREFDLCCSLVPYRPPAEPGASAYAPNFWDKTVYPLLYLRISTCWLMIKWIQSPGIWIWRDKNKQARYVLRTII